MTGEFWWENGKCSGGVTREGGGGELCMMKGGRGKMGTLGFIIEGGKVGSKRGFQWGMEVDEGGGVPGGYKDKKRVLHVTRGSYRSVRPAAVPPKDNPAYLTKQATVTWQGEGRFVEKTM